MKKLFIFTLVTLLMASCVPTAPDYSDRVSLKVTIGSQFSYAPLFIARDEGYFEEFGLDIEFVEFSGASEATALLVSGDIDVYAGTVNAGFLNTVYQSGDIKAVADRGHLAPGDCSSYAIIIRKDLFESGQVTGPADLKGLLFSGQTAGTGAYFLSTYLAEGGLTFEDIEFTDLSTGAELDAFETGAIDGATKPEPGLTQALNAGNVVVLAQAEDVLVTLQSGVIAFGDQLLTEKRDAGARFLAAYLKGVRQYNEGKTDRNLEILSQATGQDIEALKAFCWMPIHPDGRLDFAAVNGFQEWSVAQGHMDAVLTEDQFRDVLILQDALLLLNQ